MFNKIYASALFLLAGTVVYAATTITTDVLKGKPTLTISNGGGTLSLPTVTDTLVGKASTDILTNKTYDAEGTGNALSNVKDSNIKAAAAIALNKLAATTLGRALVSDGSGFIAASSVTSTTLAFLDATSSVQTQLNGKQATGNYITDLTGDVTASGPGSSAASVALVGGSTASAVNSATVLANAATSANTASAIVKRDVSGNFAAGTITASLTGTASGNPLLTSSAPASVGSANSAGSATDAAKADHVHQGVHSVAKNGSAALFGDVTLTGGTNITLTQTSNDISIAASGGGLSSAGWYIDANIGGATTVLSGSNQSTYTGLTNAGLDIVTNSGSAAVNIACAGTTAATGATCSGADESIGISFDAPIIASYQVCFSFGHLVESSAGDNQITFQLVETPNNAQTISQEGKGRVTGSRNQNSIFPRRDCGIFVFASTGTKTIRLFYEQVVGTITQNNLQMDRDANVGQRDLHVEVYILR